MTNVVTADAQGNLQCAAPIESVLQHSTAALVTDVDVTYKASSGVLSVSVQDITGATTQDTVTLPTSTQNISTWANGTTQTIVLGSDGKLYLANPTGAPSTHNPVNKTNNVDWFGAFTTMNDLLQYALSGGSFLADNSGYTKQDTAPTSPNAGDTWRTTSATLAPYAKNATYQWDGNAWLVIGGRPETVATSTGVRDVPAGAGTTFNNIGLTLESNDLNATVSASKVAIPRSGVYQIDAYLNPGSWYTTHAVTGNHAADCTLGLCVNGRWVAEQHQTVFINGDGDHIPETTFGVGCHVGLAAHLSAGDSVEIQIYVAGLVLNYAVTLKVAAISE